MGAPPTAKHLSRGLVQRATMLMRRNNARSRVTTQRLPCRSGRKRPCKVVAFRAAIGVKNAVLAAARGGGDIAVMPCYAVVLVLDRPCSASIRSFVNDVHFFLACASMRLGGGELSVQVWQTHRL